MDSKDFKLQGLHKMTDAEFAAYIAKTDEYRRELNERCKSTFLDDILSFAAQALPWAVIAFVLFASNSNL
jgi:hypothetical protein